MRESVAFADLEMRLGWVWNGNRHVGKKSGTTYGKGLIK